MAGEYVDPYQAILEAQRAKLAQPMGPMYSPEEQAQRVAQNQREYEVGMLGLLSGDQGLGGVGGHVLKQAMAARTPRVTERGTTDQLRGTHTFFPEYLRQQEEDKYAQMQQRSAQAQGAHQEALQRAAERADMQRQRAEDQRALHAAIGANRPEPLKMVMGPDGKPMWAPQSQASGMPAYAPGMGGGKMPAEIARMNIAFNALDSTIGEYLKELDTFDPRNLANQADPAKNAKINALQSRIGLEAKEAAALGALTGPDLQILGSMLSNPASLKGAAYGREGLKAQSEQMKNWVALRRNAVNQQYPTSAPSGGGGIRDDVVANPADPLDMNKLFPGRR